MRRMSYVMSGAYSSLVWIPTRVCSLPRLRTDSEHTEGFVMQALLPRAPTRVHEPFETYLSEINGTPLLNAKEEKDLAYRIEAGDNSARDHMVRANLRLVVAIARSYAGRGLDLQ